MKLLEPLQVGNMTLKNRIMFPPLTTGYEERDGSIGSRSLAFYERLAKGGVSYIVVGDVAPVRTASPTPKLFDRSQIPTYRRLAEAIHAHGSKVALQLFHPEYDVAGVGRMIMQAGMARKAAADAKTAGNMEEAARQMTLAEQVTKDAYARLHHDMKFFVSECSVEQLDQIKASIAASCAMAEEAGIDAIEVHGDRLLGSLCSKLLNHRTDSYGGAFENRTRYALEVVAAIRQAAPSLAIEYKLPVITVNSDGSLRGKGGLEAEEAIAFAKLLDAAGVDMIQVAQANHTGNMGDTIPPMGDVDYGWVLPVVKAVREVVSVPVAAVGRVVTVERGEQILKEGIADMIGYGRSLLTDPDIALKAERGEPIRTCLNCNKGCVDAIQNRRYISCVLNAENGDEATISIRPASRELRIAIIGGGIAGLEAARVAAKRGHKVAIYEKTSCLGGQINLAAIPPRKSEILRAIRYYEQILPLLNVEIHLDSEFDAGNAQALEELNNYDQILVAIGAHSMPLPMPAENCQVLDAWEVLAGAEVKGSIAILGGGLVGAETAEFLAQKGYRVSIIEMLDRIAAQESSTVLPLMKKDFAAHGVREYTNTRVSRIDGGIIYAESTQDNSPVEIPFDTVINALGSKKNTIDLSAITAPVTLIGDCSGERTADIAAAIRSGYHAANALG